MAQGKKYQNKEEIVEGFWSKVEKTDSCWNWQGAKTRGGYGIFNAFQYHGLYTESYFVHRISYWLEYGEFNTDLRVLHKCDNPSCVNPSHLSVGTQSENMKDMFDKGRDNTQAKIVRGEKHGRSKLTRDIVEQIKKEYSEGGISQSKLAKKYGINQSVVSRIMSNNAWVE